MVATLTKIVLLATNALRIYLKAEDFQPLEIHLSCVRVRESNWSNFTTFSRVRACVRVNGVFSVIISTI